MRRRAKAGALALSAALLSSCLAGVAPSSGTASSGNRPTARQACRSEGATVLANRVARLYRVGPRSRYSLYGCVRATGRRVLVGRFTHDPDEYFVLHAVRLAGRVVALDVNDCGAGPPCVGGIVVQKLSSRSFRGVSDRFAGDSAVSALVVAPSGAAAWIRRDHETGHFVVRKLDAEGNIVLDSGVDVDPRTLLLGNGAVTWRRAGQALSAPLR